MNPAQQAPTECSNSSGNPHFRRTENPLNGVHDGRQMSADRPRDIPVDRSDGRLQHDSEQKVNGQLGVGPLASVGGIGASWAVGSS